MAEGESGAPSESDRSSDSPHASCLGTHAHWEATYAAELGALREDGDEGEVWFGARVNRTVADWVTALAPPAALPPLSPSEASSDDQWLPCSGARARAACVATSGRRAARPRRSSAS